MFLLFLWVKGGRKWFWEERSDVAISRIEALWKRLPRFARNDRYLRERKRIKKTT